MNSSIFEIQADFCKAMGNTARLQMLHVLRERPLTVSEICQATNLPQGTVSRHLSVLRKVGVVDFRRLGNAKVYQITDDKIADVCDLVRSILVEQIHKRSQSIE
jgi:DNA-binding transcriptional ArsR family regulator